MLKKFDVAFALIDKAPIVKGLPYIVNDTMVGALKINELGGWFPESWFREAGDVENLGQREISAQVGADEIHPTIAVPLPEVDAVAPVVGNKFDIGKAPLHLLRFASHKQIAEALAYGARKYGEYNYLNGLEHLRVGDAIERHYGAYLDGEDIDQESGLPHLAHLGASVFILLDLVREKPELDNRYRRSTPESESTRGKNESDENDGGCPF